MNTLAILRRTFGDHYLLLLWLADYFERALANTLQTILKQLNEWQVIAFCDQLAETLRAAPALLT